MRRRAWTRIAIVLAGAELADRALELAPSSSPNVDAAFQHGYTAGANDVFSGFDGGWSVATPYVVVLRASRGPVTYRIDARLPVRAGVEYYLCPRSPTVCAQPRR